MDLEIIAVKNSNDPDEEYVRLKALIDLNSNDYIVVDKTFTGNGNLSNIFRHVYRFPSVKIKKGEFIRLFTGEGQYERHEQDNGAIVHRFYWDSEECIWNDDENDEVFVFKVVKQCSKKVEKKS